MVRSYLELALHAENNAKISFLMSRRNQITTFDDFQTMSKNLVDEILLYLSQCNPQPCKISFIGHSLGNIIIRSALCDPRLDPLLERLHTFLSLNGPHCGILYNSSVVNMGLQYFKNILLVGSFEDYYVPIHSALIESSRASSRDQSILGIVYSEMVQNLLRPLSLLGCSTVVRYSVHHSSQASSAASQWIGKAAHVAVLDSDLFIEKLFTVVIIYQLYEDYASYLAIHKGYNGIGTYYSQFLECCYKMKSENKFAVNQASHLYILRICMPSQLIQQSLCEKFYINQTTVQEVDWANLCGTYIGLVVGVIGLPLNVLVILAIGHSKNKIRNYDLLAGLAFGDVLNASSYICYSIRSIIVMNSAPFTMPPFRCLVEGVHLTLGEMAEAACSWMIALLALDRFICMSATMTYRTLGASYTYGMVIFTYVYTALDVIVSLIGSYNMEQESIFEPYCYHSRSVTKWYYHMHVYQICICGYLSMVLYALALVCLKHKGRK
uniref:G-protein coupled receptors family 1 profile domain-containing protein n=1 Tax=Romanomermis culicivorax TaxID=13658 RepID=A0A915ICW3_ROMCU